MVTLLGLGRGEPTKKKIDDDWSKQRNGHCVIADEGMIQFGVPSFNDDVRSLAHDTGGA